MAEVYQTIIIGDDNESVISIRIRKNITELRPLFCTLILEVLSPRQTDKSLLIKTSHGWHSWYRVRFKRVFTFRWCSFYVFKLQNLNIQINENN